MRPMGNRILPPARFAQQLGCHLQIVQSMTMVYILCFGKQFKYSVYRTRLNKEQSLLFGH